MAARVSFAAADIFACRRNCGGNSIMFSPIRLFTARARCRPDAGRGAGIEDAGQLADWLKLGLQRTVSGGYFTAILRADRLAEALAALPDARCQHVAALAAGGRAGQAGDPAGRARVRGAPFVLLPGLVLHDPSGGSTPEAEAVLRGGGCACPVWGPACRFRPSPQGTAES